MTSLPGARGPLTSALFSLFTGETVDLPDAFPPSPDPLADDDFQLALYCCYELHYRGFEDVDDRLEWAPGVLAFRRELEDAFEAALLKVVPYEEPVASIPDVLFS